MKLRLRKNSLRLRVNQREVESLAAGAVLEEQVCFPGGSTLSYILESISSGGPHASFHEGVISVGIPQEQAQCWANADALGIYLEFPINGTFLKVLIEKDLECVDGPQEERDPYAYPRRTTTVC